MTLGSALITATNAYYLADKPTFLGMYKPSAAKWCYNGAVADDDHTDTTYIATAAYDGHMGSFTRGDAARQTWWFLVTLASGHQTVDSIYLHILTLDASAGTPTMTIYLGDGSTDEDIENLDTDFFSSKKRLFMPEIRNTADGAGAQRQWTGAAYLKIKVDAGGGNTCRPQITEVAAGQQRQMRYAPTYPRPEGDYDNDVDRWISKSGIQIGYPNVAGRRTIKDHYELNDSTESGKISSLHADCAYGARPMVYCYNPYSAPNSALVVMPENNNLEIPRNGYDLRNWDLRALEQGGSLLADE